ncbi:hypothetical protein TW89_0272 [Neisseria flavescens]|nr:hypothetical protein TW89_0272 [Neisseria flavescens]
MILRPILILKPGPSEKDLVLKWHRFDFQTTSYERIDHEP